MTDNDNVMDFPKIRNMDGVYFRVNRGDGYEPVCWSDLTDGERERFGEGRPLEWWREMALIMTRQLRLVSDELDLVFLEDGGDDGR